MSNLNPSVIEKSRLDVPVKELGQLSSCAIGLDASASDALELMRDNTQGSLAVLKGREIVGIVTERDFLQKGDLGENSWAEVGIDTIMSSGPITLSESALVSDVIKLMAKRNFRHVPIVNEKGDFSAMVSIKDLMDFVVQFFPMHVARFGSVTSWEYLTVDDYSEEFSILSEKSDSLSGNLFMAHLRRVCDEKPLVIDQSAAIGEVVAGLKGRRKGAMLLMEYETTIKGIITERDLLFKVYDQQGVSAQSKAQDFMTPSPHLLLNKHYLAHAINNMAQYGYRNTIVVNEDRYPMGIVSLLEIFKFMAFHFYAEEISLMKKDASGNVIL
jgi:CBS domain-containing protein